MSVRYLFLLSWFFCINVSLLLLLLFLLFSGPNQILVSAGSPVGKLIFRLFALGLTALRRSWQQLESCVDPLLFRTTRSFHRLNENKNKSRAKRKQTKLKLVGMVSSVYSVNHGNNFLYLSTISTDRFPQLHPLKDFRRIHLYQVRTTPRLPTRFHVILIEKWKG